MPLTPTVPPRTPPGEKARPFYRIPHRRTPSRRRSPWRGPPRSDHLDSEQRSRSISPDHFVPGSLSEAHPPLPPHLMGHGPPIMAMVPMPPPIPARPIELGGSPEEGQPKHDYYGTTQLEQRSRSPSPSSAHSLPLGLGRRRGAGRRLPVPPGFPSSAAVGPLREGRPPHIGMIVQRSADAVMTFPTVSQSPTIPERTEARINFPHVDSSPTRLSLFDQPPREGWRVGFADQPTQAEGPGLLPPPGPPRSAMSAHAIPLHVRMPPAPAFVPSGPGASGQPGHTGSLGRSRSPGLLQRQTSRQLPQPPPMVPMFYGY